MRDADFLKGPLLILDFVQSDNFVDSNIVEDISILVWVVPVSVSLITLLNWSHEGNELSWNDPVKITVFDLLVVLILLDIESLEVVPSQLDSELEALEAMQECAVVKAVSLGSISVASEHLVVWLEHIVRLFS